MGFGQPAMTHSMEKLSPTSTLSDSNQRRVLMASNENDYLDAVRGLAIVDRACRSRGESGLRRTWRSVA